MPYNDYRTALVTGASTGMGEAITRCLVAHDITVHAGVPRERGAGCGVESGEIVARAVQRLAALFDRAEQFAHRTLKAALKPGALQLRRRGSS